MHHTLKDRDNKIRQKLVRRSPDPFLPSVNKSHYIKKICFFPLLFKKGFHFYFISCQSPQHICWIIYPWLTDLKCQVPPETHSHMFLDLWRRFVLCFFLFSVKYGLGNLSLKSNQSITLFRSLASLSCAFWSVKGLKKCHNFLATFLSISLWTSNVSACVCFHAISLPR